ncbi:hypothetical protein TNCV_2892201 [Trichonephila clavipes]|nr:hypothetical protein TNCV_2892201 [Trichonephila clavipes]
MKEVKRITITHEVHGHLKMNFYDDQSDDDLVAAVNAAIKKNRRFTVATSALEFTDHFCMRLYAKTVFLVGTSHSLTWLVTV